MDACAFQYGTHGTTSNNTRTRSSRFDQHKATTEATFHLVRDRTLEQRNLEQVLLGVFYTLGDRISYFVGFTKAVTNYAVTIANYYDGRKAEATTTFYHFGNPIDRYYALFEVSLVYF